MSVVDMSSDDISATDILFSKIYLGGCIVEELLIKKYTPITETTYYTLLSLTEEKHGYKIMQYVRELTNGRINLGTGTLYTMLGRLVADGLISVISAEGGKKIYKITDDGMNILKNEVIRLKKQLENGKFILNC